MIGDDIEQDLGGESFSCSTERGEGGRRPHLGKMPDAMLIMISILSHRAGQVEPLNWIYDGTWVSHTFFLRVS